MTFLEFIKMGGYGFFIWTAYLVTAVILALNLWLPKIRHLNQLKALTRLNQHRPAKKHDPTT